MNIKTLFFLTLLASLMLFTACGAPANANPQATIDAAVKATTEAQKNIQATIAAAVKATSQAQTAQQPTAEPAQPTPDYASLSEEELAALIDQAVNQAITDYAAASTTVTQSTSDGTVIDDEAAATTTTVTNVTYEIAYADELIQAYEEYYGAYANEAIATMTAMEDDLAAITASLNEIAAITAQGAATATAAIDQLNAAVAQAQTKASEAQTKVQGLQEQVKNGIGKRENSALNLPANNIADNQIGAINQAHDFLDAFKGALGDGKFSPDELSNISQLAANARASLDKTGDPKLQKLGGSIKGLTRNAARGEWGKAKKGVGDFERSLPARRR
jgi:chromosome segregation ATPase